MTVAECPWLDQKHTIFGKIVGPTIFNLIKISEIETDKNTDRPLIDGIPLIERTEVIEHPFDDLVPRVKEAPLIAQSKP
jgi:peptidyl-prolyl cis-trans isomerase SDCCAG10